MENQPPSEKLESVSTTNHPRLPFKPTLGVSVRTGISRDVHRVDQALHDLFYKVAIGAAPWPLFIHGGVGAGKTRAALCFCDAVYDAGYYTAEELADSIMGEGFPELDRHPLLVLDELGERTKVGDLGRTAVKRTLDERERYNNSVAIYISNFPPEELLDAYDGPIVSRLRAGTVFHLNAKDRRQER